VCVGGGGGGGGGMRWGGGGGGGRGRRIFVAFKGSSSVTNVMTDLDMRRVRYGHVASACVTYTYTYVHMSHTLLTCNKAWNHNILCYVVSCVIYELTSYIHMS